MNNLDVPYPFGGVDENRALTSQPPNTTREALNMRGIDPASGRLRGAQRPGTSRYAHVTVNGSNRVQRIETLIYNDKLGTYSAKASPVTADWSYPLPAGEDNYAIVADELGNVYASDGRAAIYKYNSEGDRIWELPLLLDKSSLSIRTLAYSGGFLYAATSGNYEFTETPAKGGKIYSIIANAESPEIFWVMEIPEMVKRMFVKDGLLYCAANDDENWKSDIIIFRDIFTENPTEEKRFDVAYPLNDIGLLSSGEILTASEANANREYMAKSTTRKHFVVGTPDEFIADYGDRIWSWYHSENIDGYDNATLTETDEKVNYWHDSSGNNRHLRNFEIDTKRQPSYIDRGGLRRPAVKFSTGFDPATTYQYLRSEVAMDEDRESKEQLRTSVPTSFQHRYVTFMVVKPTWEAVERVIMHVSGMSGGGAYNRIIAANFAGTSGVAGIYRSGGGTSSLAGAHTNTDGSCLITHIHDSTLATNELRINGTSVATWNDISNGCSGTTSGVFYGVNWNGGAPVAATSYRGEMYEILTLDVDTVIFPTHPATTAAEVQDIEGYLAWKYGIMGLLPGGHNHASTSGPPDEAGVAAQQYTRILLGNGPQLSKYDSNGRLIWCQDGGASTVYIDGGVTQSGFGYGIGVGPDDEIYTIGPARTPVAAPIGTYYFETGEWDEDGDVHGQPLTLVMLNAFVGATPGERIYITGGTGATIGFYEIATVISANEVTLTTSIGAGADGQTDISFYREETTKDAAICRKIVDNGTTVTWFGTGTWLYVPIGVSVQYVHPEPRCAVDRFGNFLMPTYMTGIAAVNFYAFTPDWALPFYTASDITNAASYAVDVGPIPDFFEDAIEQPEYFFLATSRDAGSPAATDPTIHRYTLTSHAPDTPGSPRRVIAIAIAGNAFKKFTPSAMSNPASGAVSFTSTGTIVDSCVLFGEAFFTNGDEYKVWNPIRSPYWEEGDALGETCIKFRSKGSGVVPPRCQLIAGWRGRLVLAHQSADPNMWFMSRQGNPYDWDFRPYITDGTEAVAGTDSRIGPNPDIINAVVPASDDYLIFGGDHTIHRMTGDPAAGGVFDLISDATGMAFGRSWCKDPDGLIYFWGSRGGLYVMSLNGEVQEISRERVQRATRDYDLSVYRPELVYDEFRDGLMVTFIGYGAAADLQTHWFWERKTGAFYQDTYGSLDITPSCMHILDGDEASDRVILMGCEDGWVRYVNNNAATDDSNGTPVNIDSLVLIGPLMPANAPNEHRYTRYTPILANGLSGAEWELYVTDELDDLGSPVAAGYAHPGRNIGYGLRARGAYAYLKLHNGGAERWAYESSSLAVANAGRRRVRG